MLQGGSASFYRTGSLRELNLMLPVDIKQVPTVFVNVYIVTKILGVRERIGYIVLDVSPCICFRNSSNYLRNPTLSHRMTVFVVWIVSLGGPC